MIINVCYSVTDVEAQICLTSGLQLKARPEGQSHDSIETGTHGFRLGSSWGEAKSADACYHSHWARFSQLSSYLTWDKRFAGVF
jgi:hypothetical protein